MIGLRVSNISFPSRVLSLENHFIVFFRVIWPILLQCSAQLHQLLLIAFQWWFRWIKAALNTLHPADPIKYRAWVWRHEYSVLSSMLMVRLACITIFCTSDYRSVSIFYHSSSRYDAKTFSSMSLKQQFTSYFAPFDVPWLAWHSISLFLNPFQWLSNGNRWSINI